jgi:hypothetical protein
MSCGQVKYVLRTTSECGAVCSLLLLLLLPLLLLLLRRLFVLLLVALTLWMTSSCMGIADCSEAVSDNEILYAPALIMYPWALHLTYSFEKF